MHAGLREVRDQKEVSFLSKLLLEVGHKRFEVAVDLMSMRIREILQAKRDSSSWEKAAVMSLLPGPHRGQAPLPDGAFVV